MVMQAIDDNGPDEFSSEGRTETLGVLLPPTVAAAIRRTGNRKKSISQVLLSLIDRRKLKRLMDLDAEHQRKCDELGRAN